jgi:hydroxymethylglutaryl-CoA lyase
MQGWPTQIPTSQKISYIQSLLDIGFDTIDAGSFVSPKAIPQMADTKEVLTALKPWKSETKILVIVANLRGAEEASVFDNVTYLGYPFSVSEVFQEKNTNSSIEDSLRTVEMIQETCLRMNKQLVVYLSMAFGNPYGEFYNEGIVFNWANKLAGMGIKILSLADTVGIATPQQVLFITKHVIDALPDTEIGVHLHSTSEKWQEKINAAYDAGCLRFDGALKGIGGCPMSGNDLVGNMNTVWLIDHFIKTSQLAGINRQALDKSLQIADKIFIS